MKTWTIPVATAQKFVANDYVSACGYEILCDIETPEGINYLQIPGSFDWNQDGTADFKGNLYASACGVKHVVGRDTQFYDYTFYRGGPNHNATGVVDLESPITVKYWIEVNEAGEMVNGHFTAPENVANMTESNKS